jgi:signal transduction histidine kinase
MPLLASAFARRTFALMLIGLMILLGIVGTSMWLASRTSDHADAVILDREIRTLSSSVYASAVNAETGQRGFLLTEDPRYLEPYTTAKVRLPVDLARLRDLVAGDPDAARNVAQLSSLIEAKLIELAETSDLAASGNREKALDMVRSDRGRELMDQIREVLRSLITVTEARVSDRLTKLSTDAETLTWTTLIGGTLIIIVTAGAFWMVARNTRDLVYARAELSTLNLNLEERVTERTGALQRANDEIQRFAYIVSHDLRAPLVNIMGFTSELEVGAGTLQQFVASGQADAALADAARVAANEDLPEAVRFIRASTIKMDGLINAILKLSREGRRDLKAEPVDLGKLFTAAGASVQHQVEEAGATIDIPPRLPTIVSDRLALEQVFGNLIDNAVKYLARDRPGRINVTAEEKAGRIRIVVADNGRGIAPQDHERIFELFRRAGAQDRPGEGVGLAHVRALVRRLGGDITVSSRLGEGSAFQVELPKRFTVSNESYTLS